MSVVGGGDGVCVCVRVIEEVPMFSSSSFLLTNQDAPFNPSMFGGVLDDIYEAQDEKGHHSKLPWVVTVLGETVLKLKGLQTEGIFR